MSICSVVVHTRPEMFASVNTRLGELSGVEIHGGSEQGKLVVTVEGDTDTVLADKMAAFNDVDGVINAVMIYHYCGDESENEEVVQ